MAANLDSVGKRVAYARKFRSLTQHELAAKAQIAQSSLATLEAERVKTSRNLVQIAQALDVPMEWLATGKHSGSTINDVLLKNPAWNAPEAVKNLHHLLRQAVPGEYSEAYEATGRPSSHQPSGDLRLLTWSTTALLDADNADKGLLAQQKRFSWPYEHSPRAFLLRMPGDFCIPAFRMDDLILVDPEAPAENGRSIVAVSTAGDILVGRLITASPESYLLTSVEDGSEVLTVFSDLNKVVGVITSRIQRV